jgi:hypothetical protein
MQQQAVLTDDKQAEDTSHRHTTTVGALSPEPCALCPMPCALCPVPSALSPEPLHQTNHRSLALLT